jgi:hypothetical protein
MSNNAKVTTLRIEALHWRVLQRSIHQPPTSAGIMAGIEARTEKNLVARPVLSLKK